MTKQSYPIEHYALRLLQQLDRALLGQGCSFEGIVVGSAAVALIAPSSSDLFAQDVDITKENKEGLPVVELLFPPFPDYLQAAAREVAEAEGLDLRWLDRGPPAINTLFSSGLDVPLELPQGWQGRISPLVFRGDALHLHAPGRLDLIALEVAEAQHGEVRPEVLRWLAPTTEELSRVDAWLAELKEEPS